MLREISLSEARKDLSEFLRAIEADPGTGYRILIGKRVVAELRSPAPTRRKNAGAAMLKLAREIERLAPQGQAETGRAAAARYKEHLCGSKSLAGSGKRR